jgi:hypothetical protein
VAGVLGLDKCGGKEVTYFCLIMLALSSRGYMKAHLGKM